MINKDTTPSTKQLSLRLPLCFQVHNHLLLEASLTVTVPCECVPAMCPDSSATAARLCWVWHLTKGCVWSHIAPQKIDMVYWCGPFLHLQIAVLNSAEGANLAHFPRSASLHAPAAETASLVPAELRACRCLLLLHSQRHLAVQQPSLASSCA